MAGLANTSNRGSSKFSRIDFNVFDPPSDPGTRPQICEYHPNDREGVRRSYLAKGPCQPKLHDFVGREIGTRLRGFNPRWYDDFGSWLEYSMEKEAMYCFFCFLFKSELRGRQGGGDAFVVTGWKAWNKGKDALLSHIGKANSIHMQNESKARALLNQRQSISSCFIRQTEKSRKDHRVRLNASLDCIRYLLCQGMAFRAHDESANSRNKGNFIELLKFLADHNADVKNVALENAPKNLQLISSDFQKEMVHAAAHETTIAIIRELGDELFAILVDESRDVSCKEQMALVIRFVRKDGSTVERFLGIVHVLNTAAATLKVAMESKLAEHSLSLSRIRGQGYDGASNMRGEFNGLKSLILKTNSSVYYVHCFAHQLQLTLVAVANSHIDVAHLFTLTDKIQNIVGASCKRKDMLRERQAAEIAKALNNGEKETGKGQNQEMGLSRAGATRWGSHYGTVNNVIGLFTPILDVLEMIEEEAVDFNKKGEAKVLLDGLPSFDCVFVLHLMQDVLGLTNVLSQALQKKRSRYC
ncbi:zinc finger MYM-type-like protein [Rhynchospora pubera]|uniref:Zinc finger MYM-type-like protein n=1 Tax=Rhynchospora pubera TaxID=906938 RepID=A0AAV8D2E9_9POAL|nr:zinc finger MYM-type-like protein [Rhynchospora pubera]